MNSINGLQKSINEIEIIEKIEELLEEEKKNRFSVQNANHFSNNYFTYLSQKQFKDKSEANANTLLSHKSIQSAYLLCEPKQLNFNSHEEETILSFIRDESLDEKKCKDDEKAFKNIELRERASSPVCFPQTKCVQTDNQQMINRNTDINDLINELKSLLKITNEANLPSIKCLKDTNQTNRLSKATQTSLLTNEKCTQYKLNNKSESFGTQTELSLTEKGCQTVFIEDKDNQIKRNNCFTQTDQLTDEEKSSNSYEFSIGEMPYFYDYSDSSSYC